MLVVDDNRLSAKKLAMTVSALGHDVETASDGLSALELLRRRNFDAVFLDIMMPEMDGFEVLRTLKADETLKDVPVIVVSALEREVDSVARALKLGAEDFLPKSYDLTILKARLDSTLEKKFSRDRELAYLRDVDSLVHAAQIIQAGSFKPSDLVISHVASRSDQLGQLANVLEKLTDVLYTRERQNDLRVRTLWGSIMVIVCGVLFASGPSFARLGTQVGVAYLDMAIWGNIVGVIVCLVIAVHRGGIPRYRLAHLRFCLIWAFVYGFSYKVWLVVVAENVEATTIALIASSRAFMVFLLAAFIALERPSGRRLLGLAVGLAAVGIVLLAQGAFESGGSTPWLFATLGLPLLLAIHTLLMAWRPMDLDAFAATALMLAVSVPMLVALGTALDMSLTELSPDLRTGTLIVGFGVATSLAVALALDIVARAGAVFASQLAYVQTLAGIAWGMVLLDERMPPLAWVAITLVVVGFLLVQPKQAGDEFSISLPANTTKPA